MQHERYLSRRGELITREAARELLEGHSDYGLVPENIAQPRVVLLASSFPPVVTATTVWLSERSLDITLMRLQAYQAREQVIVTVSQLYPVPDVEEFTVAPARSAKAAADDKERLPEVPWTSEDLERLRDVANSTVLAALDLCAARPGEWIALRQVEQVAGRQPALRPQRSRAPNHDRQTSIRALELAFRCRVRSRWRTAGVLQDG